MQQLLMDRFRGVFLGVAVLEAYLLTNADSWSDTKGHDKGLSAEPLGWCEAMVQGQLETLAFTPSTPNHSQVPSPVPPIPDEDLARLVASIIPAALFYHEDINRLDAFIRGSALWEADCQTELLGIGVAIALLCTEQAHPQTLIPQLLAQECLAGTTLQAQLQASQTFLHSQASLWEVGRDSLATPSSPGAALAIACYCWASTANNFTLTVKRALALSRPAGLLACALSGAFNGVHAIPFPWQALLVAPNKTRASILSQADQLLGAWSGYLSYQTLLTPLEQTAVSAPGLLRPRSSESPPA